MNGDHTQAAQVDHTELLPPAPEPTAQQAWSVDPDAYTVPAWPDQDGRAPLSWPLKATLATVAVGLVLTVVLEGNAIWMGAASMRHKGDQAPPPQSVSVSPPPPPFIEDRANDTAFLHQLEAMGHWQIRDWNAKDSMPIHTAHTACSQLRSQGHPTVDQVTQAMVDRHTVIDNVGVYGQWDPVHDIVVAGQQHYCRDTLGR